MYTHFKLWILSHHALLLRSVPPLVGPGALVGGGGDDTFAGRVGELVEDPASDMFVCATSRIEQVLVSYDPRDLPCTSRQEC